MDEYATDPEVLRVLRSHASPEAVDELSRTAAVTNTSLRKLLGAVVNEWATLRLVRGMASHDD